MVPPYFSNHVNIAMQQSIHVVGVDSMSVLRRTVEIRNEVSFCLFVCEQMIDYSTVFWTTITDLNTRFPGLLAQLPKLSSKEHRRRQKGKPRRYYAVDQ